MNVHNPLSAYKQMARLCNHKRASLVPLVSVFRGVNTESPGAPSCACAPGSLSGASWASPEQEDGYQFEKRSRGLDLDSSEGPPLIQIARLPPRTHHKNMQESGVATSRTGRIQPTILAGG